MSLRVAVAGVGYLGAHHARIYSELPGVELVAVADASLPRAREIAERHGCRAVADVREVLGEIDALSIVTPTVTHFDIALECLRAGKDLMLEKPLTATVAEADVLIKEAASLGRLIQVGHLERYNPAIKAARAMVKKPILLEAERMGPFSGRGTDVDITLDLMIHDLDMVMWFASETRVRDLRASGSGMITGGLDAAMAWLELEGGTVATLMASRMAGYKRRVLRVYEEDNFIEVDYQNASLRRAWRSKEGYKEENIEVPKAEPLKEELADFVDCVRQRRRPLVSATEGREALALALLITNKAKETA